MNPNHVARIIGEGKEAFNDNMVAFHGNGNKLRSRLLGVHGEDRDVLVAIRTIYEGTQNGYDNAVEKFESMRQNA